GWGLNDLHCARLSHPPYPPIASQSISRDVAMSPCEGLPNFPTCPRGSGQGCPLLRALDSRHLYSCSKFDSRSLSIGVIPPRSLTPLHPLHIMPLDSRF